MKVVVDLSICDLHGLCVEAAPEVFEIGDDGDDRAARGQPGASNHAPTWVSCASPDLATQGFRSRFTLAVDIRS